MHLISRLKNGHSNFLCPILQVIYIFALCLIGFSLAQASCYSYLTVDPILPKYFIPNLLLLAALFFLLSFPWKKLSTGGIIFSVFVFILSIINFYTLVFHGSLFTVSELENAKTAFNVMDQYNFFDPNILKEIWKLPVLFLILLLLSFLENYVCERDVNQQPTKLRPIKFIGFLLCTSLIFAFFTTDYVKKYTKPINNSWNQSVDAHRYGYPLTLYSSAKKFELSSPEGYELSNLDNIEIPKVSPSTTAPPDIILILNESFYDLQQVADLEMDCNPLENFFAIPDAIYGRTVTRNGGGTNLTEFELLTSIPQFIVGATPFNVLDMTNIPSIVSLLREQGYYTIGTHTDNSQNYNRINAYNQIGFDEVYFLGDYQDREMYASRWGITDKNAYQHVIQWYENAQKTNMPIFTYCLTNQNHGGWNQNSPDENLIHVQNYSGAIDENQLNEYLSCVKLSGDAFAWLCDYFRQVDRPVVICMIGDHSPSFTDSIANFDLEDHEKIVKSSTPFVIWANYDLGFSESNIGALSSTAVGPLLLKAAGVQYSPFYQYILNLIKKTPVVTGWSEYMDLQGNVYTYSSHTPDVQPIWDYFYLSYNNLLPDSRETWFALPNS